MGQEKEQKWKKEERLLIRRSDKDMKALFQKEIGFSEDSMAEVVEKKDEDEYKTKFMPKI